MLKPLALCSIAITAILAGQIPAAGAEFAGVEEAKAMLVRAIDELKATSLLQSKNSIAMILDFAIEISSCSASIEVMKDYCS